MEEFSLYETTDLGVIVKKHLTREEAKEVYLSIPGSSDRTFESFSSQGDVFVRWNNGVLLNGIR